MKKDERIRLELQSRGAFGHSGSVKISLGKINVFETISSDGRTPAFITTLKSTLSEQNAEKLRVTLETIRLPLFWPDNENEIFDSSWYVLRIRTDNYDFKFHWDHESGPKDLDKLVTLIEELTDH